MLKKLSKYGNSTTLVIDKAILELLNMDESSMVKLQTDGKSLIITPVASASKEKVSYGGAEAFHVAAQTLKQAGLAQIREQPAVQEIMPMMQKDFKEAFEKHKTAMEAFSKNLAENQGFQEALEVLAQKYDPVTQSQEYMQELCKLKAELFPELAEFHKDIEAIALKYNNI